MGMAGTGYVLQPGEGRNIDLGAFSMSVKATGDDTGGLFTLLEADEPPDFGPPMHIHQDCGEAFYVLQGEYNIFIRDEEFRCPSGSFIFIPQDTPHGFRVGNVPSKKLNLYLPAAMMGYFDELSSAIAEGKADDERLGQIALRNGVEVIGSVPEGYL